MWKQQFLFKEVRTPSFSKQPKIVRYQKLRKQLEEEFDKFKTFVSIDTVIKPLKTFTFVDLFAGAGGMSLGFVQAGFKDLAAVELDELAVETYKRNFSNVKIIKEDIRNITGEKIKEMIDYEEITVVIGGPPCQGFSVAGDRKVDDARNSLVFEFIRMVSELSPWYFVMENVPGILTLGQGKFRKEIQKRFKDIGYNVSVAILESADYGVPQIRPRAIFIGNRFNFKNPFPKPLLCPREYKSVEDALKDLPPWIPLPEINHEWTKHSPQMIERISKVKPGESLYDSYYDAWKRLYPGYPSFTIKENHGGTHIHPYLNRCISAREMARLQSFPDDFIFVGRMKKVMWQVGNSVPPLLAKAIGLALIPFLNKLVESTSPSL